MEDSFLPYNLAISAYDFFSISIISVIFIFALMERTSRLLLVLEPLPPSLLFHFEAIIMVNEGFLNTHCDNAATNSNSENARSRMVASLWGSVYTGDKGSWVKYWACLGCWISPCYGPFWLGARFETYELFISLIFKLFSGRSISYITETLDTESADIVYFKTTCSTCYSATYVYKKKNSKVI